MIPPTNAPPSSTAATAGSAASAPWGIAALNVAHIDPGHASRAAALQPPSSAASKRPLSPEVQQAVPAIAKRARTEGSQLDTLPMELVVLIVDALPNTAQARVASLAMTSRQLHQKAIGATLKKAPARLMERIGRIGITRGVEMSATYAAQRRLDDFSNVLGHACGLAQQIPGSHVLPVLIALAGKVGQLGAVAPEAFRLMLQTLEELDQFGASAPASGAGQRAAEQLALDHARQKMLLTLTHDVSMLTAWPDEHKRDAFDRLCTVLERMESPAVIDQAARTLRLGGWYGMHPQALGTGRCDRLVLLIERQAPHLQDESIGIAVRGLLAVIHLHPEDVDMVRHFTRLCGVAARIQTDANKARAAILFNKSVRHLPDAGPATADAYAAVARLTSGIEDARELARVRAELQMLQATTP